MSRTTDKMKPHSTRHLTTDHFAIDFSQLRGFSRDPGIEELRRVWDESRNRGSDPLDQLHLEAFYALHFVAIPIR